MEKAVGYVRVSTAEQASEGVSLDAQEERLQAYATANNIHVVYIIREEGVSGTVPLAQRPGGEKLLSTIGKGKTVKHVIALKLDRLFRDASDCLVQTKVWDKSGIGLHLLDMGGQSINTASAMGRMFLTMSAGFAELERNLIAERTSAAMQHKKKRLEAYSPTPFGYQRIGDHLEAVEQEQQIVRNIYSLRESGATLRDIAATLNEHKIPTKKKGKQWYASTVRGVLNNDLHI